MLKIDYDAVTIDIQDYIIDICMVTTDLLEKYKALDEIEQHFQRKGSCEIINIS